MSDYTPTTEEVRKVEEIYLGRNKPLTRLTWKVTFTDGTYLCGKAWSFQKARLQMLAVLKSFGENNE